MPVSKRRKPKRPRTIRPQGDLRGAVGLLAQMSELAAMLEVGFGMDPDAVQAKVDQIRAIQIKGLPKDLAEERDRILESAEKLVAEKRELVAAHREVRVEGLRQSAED